ncbi:hypothetical protein M5K25_008247 [Dendrobium thyrsiflorum]|uniref:Uncharacterized protein n=1 Tax=Dendrobium thyrsiflorum TaxID=117978 RepID=A0ABD0V873_DENTH
MAPWGTLRHGAPFAVDKYRMVGEWMMDPIKIPWFRRPGSSWSLVYLVRGGSRPNLTEGSLSAAMGCFVQGYLVDLGIDAIGEHTGAGHNRNIRITWFRGPRVITVYPAVPFGGKTAGQRTRTTSLLARDCLRMSPSDILDQALALCELKRRTGFPSHHVWKKRAWAVIRCATSTENGALPASS